MKGTLMGSIAAAAVLALPGCGGDDSESDVSAFCDKVDELGAAEDPAAGIAPDDVEGQVAALEKAQGLLNEVADVAPDEIQADVEDAQAFFGDFVAAAQDANAPEDFAAVAQDFQDEAADFQETSARLTDYTNENCGEPASGG